MSELIKIVFVNVKWQKRKSFEVKNDKQSVGLTVEATRSIFRASIWAVRPDCRKDGGEDEENLCHCSFVSFVERGFGIMMRRAKKKNSMIFNSIVPLLPPP